MGLKGEGVESGIVNITGERVAAAVGERSRTLGAAAGRPAVPGRGREVNKKKINIRQQYVLQIVSFNTILM